jgi:thiamine pyrophosphokinase
MGNTEIHDWAIGGRFDKELTHTRGLVETLRARIVKSEQEVLKLRIRVRRLETKIEEKGRM